MGRIRLRLGKSKGGEMNSSMKLNTEHGDRDAVALYFLFSEVNTEPTIGFGKCLHRDPQNIFS